MKKNISTSKPSQSKQETDVPVSKPKLAMPQVVMPKITFKKVMLPLLVVALILGLFVFRRLFVVAIVNGKPITRLSVVSELEKQSGKQMLDELIVRSLVFEEAKKQGITVTNEEVANEIATIESNVTGQGQDLNQLLATQGMTRDQLEDQIKIQKTAEKLAQKDVAVTDEEVASFIEQNKSTIPEGTSDADLQQMAKTRLEQTKLQQAVQDLITNLRAKATINYL